VAVPATGGSGRGPDQHVAHAHLAPTVALPVVAGKALHQDAGEWPFAVHKDPLAGHKDIVEDDQRLVPAERGVTHVQA